MHPSHLDEPSSEVPPRIKVLLIAYACEPNQGSEPGTGWNLAVGLARYCDVTVVTRANNKGVIERALPTGEGLRLRFVYIDPSAFYLKLKRKKYYHTRHFMRYGKYGWLFGSGGTTTQIVTMLFTR
jgi:hypothetical protein